MTPPGWRRKVDSGEEAGKRLAVLETLGGVTEIAYCPPDVAISHYDLDDAEAEGRTEAEEAACGKEVEHARERARTIIDERAAIEVLSDCRERAEKTGERRIMDLIDEVLAPVRASTRDDGGEHLRRPEAGEE